MAVGVLFGSEHALVACDETLLAAWRSVADEWLAEPPSDEAVRELAGRALADALPAFVSRWFPHREVDEAVRVFSEHYHQCVRSAPLRARAGADALLGALTERGVPFACLGPISLDRLLYHLHESALLDQCPVCVGRDEVAAAPPAPELVCAAAERLGLRPADCVTIETTPIGLCAAAAAGATSIGLVGLYSAEELEQAAFVVRDLPELDVDALLRVVSDA